LTEAERHDTREAEDMTAVGRTLTPEMLVREHAAVGAGGDWPAWYGSHIHGSFQRGVGRPMHPQPDGLAVGYLDGAVKFAKWKTLTPGNHEGDYVVYYNRDS